VPDIENPSPEILREGVADSVEELPLDPES
jgi:hypothetical protein